MRIKKLAVLIQALLAATLAQAENTAYDTASGTATIPEVVVDGKVVFVNVKLKSNPDGTFSILSTEAPPISPSAATYDPVTGLVTLPAVEVDGKVEFVKAKLGLSPDLTQLSVLSTEAPPVVHHSESCSDFVEAIYTQDDGETVAGMYCDQGSVEHAAEQSPATCSPDTDQLAKVEVGMTYDQVVELAGCHPFLSNAGKHTTYVWGTKWAPDSWETTHSADFVDGKIASRDAVFCGPSPCYLQQ